MPAPSPDQHESTAIIEQRLAALRSECGCRAGMAGLILGLAVFVSYDVVGHSGALQLRPTALAGCALGLGGGVIGKLVGLAWARYRYRVLWRRLTS